MTEFDVLAAGTLPELTPDETRRYGRHLTLPEVGPEGQRRLKQARVLMVGAGGLGSPVGLYLAAAGVGTLGIVDFDRVDVSNLQRQVLYGQDDLDRPKVEAARERLAGVNPHIRIVTHAERLDADNVIERIDGYDVVVDGSDNFPTRYLVNDACAQRGKPNVWGAIQRFEGQVSVFWGGRGPCYRCLFPEPPPAGTVPSCAEAGVFGVLPGIIGSLQANEVIKLILGVGEPLIGRLLIFDALRLRFREVRLAACGDYPSCAEGRVLSAAEAGCSMPTTTHEEEATMSRQEASGEVPLEITVEQLKAWQDEGRDIALIDVREPVEYAIGQIAGSTLIPLRQLPAQLAELDTGRLTVVHCHHGPRSSQAVAYLRQEGFESATNLAGGIDAWSQRIDPAVPRY